MSVNKVLFVRMQQSINGRVKIWNKIILLLDQFEADLHMNDCQYGILEFVQDDKYYLKKD